MNMKNELKEYDKAFLHYLNGEYNLLTEEQKNIFTCNMPDISPKNITIRDICRGLGIEVPEEYELIADEPQKLAFRSKYVKPGNICFIIRSAEDFEAGTLDTRWQYDKAVENGAKLIIMGRKAFYDAGLDLKKHPVILVDDINERVLRFFSIFRARQKAKVVMLTGSVGKTTTKDLCAVITGNHFKTFINAKNSNSVHKTAKHAFSNCDKDNDVYIQECGAGFINSVRFAASILQPDIFILTNVYEHHLQMYKNYENLFRDKVSGDDYLQKDGIVITNYDDENIRKHSFKNKLITFAVDYENADYRAINIKQFRDELSFDIVEKATGHVSDIKVKMLGKHNVYNVLAAFVLGRVLGISEKDIKADLLEYRTSGIRQNLVNIGGVYINVDCYNVAEESITAMLKAGENFELDNGCRRIALIGGENKLGDNVSERSRSFGKKLADMDIKVDEILFCGVKRRDNRALNKYGNAVSMKRSFEKVSDISSSLSTGIKSMTRFLSKSAKCGDLVMIKGIYWLNMAVAIDKVFGTSFSFDLGVYKDITSRIYWRGYTASLIKVFKEVEITAAPVIDGKLTIPGKIHRYPVFRIKNSAFKGDEDITRVDFGKSIKNIGEEAFCGCAGIERLNIPSNMKVIEQGVFRKCTNLKKVIISEGLTHISTKAFAECVNLNEIHIPDSVGMIEEHVFKDSPNVTIVCGENSFAHRYALKNNIEFKYK